MNGMKTFKRILIQIITAILCIFIFTASVVAHSGRTDSSGGHKDNKNKSGLGSYHYHCGGYPAHLHTGGGCPYSGGGESSTSVASVPTPSISIEQAPSELNVGDSSGLEFSVDNATGSSSSVESSDSEVVRVNEDNTLTAVNEGTATITITASDISKTFTVSVKSVPVEEIVLNETNLDLQLGHSFTLEATVSPENATDKTISWVTDNNDIIELSETGKIKAKAVGTASVICTANNGVESVCNVNVFEVFPEKIVADMETIDVECKKSIAPNFTVMPENANNKKLSFKIANEDVATVDEAGKVTGVLDGETELIITTENGVTSKIPITVYHIPVERIIIDTSNIEFKYKSFADNIITNKEQLDLTVNVEPHEATYDSIEWESSDKGIIDIVKGHPEIVGTGNVTLTVVGHDGVTEAISFKIINEDAINGAIAAAILAIVGIPSGILLYKKRKKNLEY